MSERGGPIFEASLKKVVKPEPRNRVMKRALEGLETLPFDDFESRQRAMEQISRSFLERNKDKFVIGRDLVRIFDMGEAFGRGGSGQLREVLETIKVPVGTVYGVAKGTTRRTVFIHKRDLEQIREFFKDFTNLS